MAAALTCGIGHPIDVVFTWVDGTDASWRASFDEWSAVSGPSMGADARDPARYRDNGELRFALRSVHAFAPWVRRIHLVTAGHVPSWFRTDTPGIRVVPHREILGDGDLPTFNSHAIEARLHHIRGLAEHFVYLNDDVFLARPQRPSSYFDDGGRPCVPMEPSRLHLPGGASAASCDRSAVNGLRLIVRDVGSRPALRPRHGPFPLRRSHLLELEGRFGPQLAATASHRFRHPADVSLPSYLAPMHGLATGHVRRSDTHVVAVNVDARDLAVRLAGLGPGTRADSFCLNDTERVEPPARTAVTAFLRHRFPNPGPWEIDDQGGPSPAVAPALASPFAHRRPLDGASPAPSGPRRSVDAAPAARLPGR